MSDEITITVPVDEVAVAAMAASELKDVLLQMAVVIPYVNVVGEDNVSTLPETASIVLSDERLAVVNRIRRAVATNRDTFIGGDQNFATNQDAVNFLIDLVALAIGS